jgi:hypothetical protein
MEMERSEPILRDINRTSSDWMLERYEGEIGIRDAS